MGTGQRGVFATPSIHMTLSSDGGSVLWSTLEPGLPARNIGVWLRHWAEATPASVFLAERQGGRWATSTYAAVAERAEAIGQALLDRRLSPDRPVLVLSGNSVDHALLSLGCQVVGIPVAPLSAAYSLACTEPDKVQRVIDLIHPGMVFADDGDLFGKVLARLDLRGAEVVVSSGGSPDWTRLDSLTATIRTSAVDAASDTVRPETVAKFLFTSGSTGSPKAVPNTHRMMCSNQESLAAIWPLVENERPVLVDWLPWSHTFGGNHNFNLVLRNGGSLYIDAGRPTPGDFSTTLQNVTDVRPNIYLNVPLGFGLLVEAMEADAQSARLFFSQLRLAMYAAAPLPTTTWERLQALAIEHTGTPILMTTSWGATETAPLALSAHFPLDGPTTIGVPVPGVEVKLAPVDDRFELRVRGANVAAGYLGDDQATAAAFDDEGFYRTGDAGRLVDDQAPEKGIVFDGRIGENFKMSSGTWVNVSALRLSALTRAAPWLQDAVVTGEGQHEIGLLAWPTAQGRGLGLAIADRLRRALDDPEGGAATRIARILLLDDPPSIDSDEITDKGYINQRAVLRRRAAEVARLYRDPASDEILVIS